MVSPACGALAANVKVQNNVPIYEGVDFFCEDDVFRPLMVFTNVINPRSAVIRKHEYKRRLSAGCEYRRQCHYCLWQRGSVRYVLVGRRRRSYKTVLPYAFVVGKPIKANRLGECDMATVFILMKPVSLNARKQRNSTGWLITG